MNVNRIKFLPVMAAILAGAARADSGPPPVPVEVAAAHTAHVAPKTWIPGSIVSRADAKVAGVIAGRIDWIADVGDRVAVGAALARLDQTMVKLRVADLEAQVARARSQADLAGIQLQRFQSLAESKIYSPSQLDESRTQLDVAKHEVERLTAQLKQAQFDVSQTEIRAPFAGVVTERFAQRGEYLQVGASVVHLVSTTEIEARATAALALADNVKAGQVTTVRVGAEARAATVRTLVPVGDDRSRQFEVRVSLAKGAWPVGTAVEVSVPTGAERVAVVVPRDAIVIRQPHSYVMRVTNAKTVERREVEVGTAVDDQIEIRGGIADGDRLVVRGAEHLEPGQAVILKGPG